MLGLIGIVLSLILLMFLAYRGMTVIVLAPLLAMLAAVFDGSTPVLATYTQVFMPSLGNYVMKYFPLFLLGAIFGKLMEDSGAARVIAHAVVRKVGGRRAILATVISCAVLTYGGVSLFVVAFAVYPLAAAMFHEAHIPKRLIPGSIALGSFTFTMSCLPGSPQIQNLIPMPYFKTTAFAAPVAGTLAGCLIFLAGMGWLNWRASRAASAREGYGAQPLVGAPSVALQGGSLWTALIPILAVIGLNYAFSQHLMPRWDTAYLAQAKYGATELKKVLGTWAMIAAMVGSVGLAIVLHLRSYKALNQSITQGAFGSFLPIFNTASEVGYGATIASLPAFAAIKNAVVNIFPNPLASEAVAVNVLAGITGSASGGLSIALEALGDSYFRSALESGINPELMHRVAVMSSGGLDTLPHNGAVITLLAICGLTHRQSYLDIAIVSLVIPVLVTALTVGAVLVFGA